MTKRWMGAVPVVVLGLLLSGCNILGLVNIGEVIAATDDVTYPIVDTGQVTTYDNIAEITPPAEGDAFYGQDAQVEGNPPNYVDNGDGTVTDLVTGLTWTQGYYGKMTYSDAVAMADGFSFAGYADWRLPTIKELYSLIDFRGEDVDPQATSANKPFIDTTHFDFAYGDTAAGERIIDSQWVTTSLYSGSTDFAGGAQLMFGVNFADGRIKGYPIGATMGPGGQEKTYYVRLVRGNTAYDENDFIDNGDGTITDLATGLMWSQDDSGGVSSSRGTAIASNGGAMDWQEALAYVQELNAQNYLGYSDWYLPNAKELQSIVDSSRSPDATTSAAIDPVFHVTSITNEAGQLDWGFYWTSTTHASQHGGQSAVYIAFGRGLGYMNGQFMDVHGAGCQRTDPKTGPAEPYGHGPQGDVQRVDNFVRVVRDGANVVASVGVGEGEVAASPSPVDDVAETEYEEYVLFAPLNGQTAYLIDRDGNVVHDWAISGRPGNSVYLLEGGELLATYAVQGKFEQGGVGGGVERLRWDGQLVWSFELANDVAHLHHDVERLPNGNVLMIAWEVISRPDALAAGLSIHQLPDAGEVWSEMILEYDPDVDCVVWEWHLWDHVLPEGWDASEHPEKIDLDFFANSSSADWWHINSVDYSAEHDQIILSSRAASEFWILDHDLVTAEAAGNAGDLLYRWGNPSAHGGRGAQVLLNQHDAEWIDNDTVLVFDNGNPRSRPYCRIVEVDLPDYENGRFEDATIVWEYGAASGDEHFFADHISGAQRLESGNTLICSGTEGRFFEVTPAGETVWEYVHPITWTERNGKKSNEVFRCEAYSADYIGQELDATSIRAAPPDSQAASPPSPQEGGRPQAAGEPPKIARVEPSSITAGTFDVQLTIRLTPSFAPPDHVPFTSVAIGPVQATTWARSGNTVRAWFDIPAQLSSGTYPLSVTFPGRNQQPITFRTTVRIR